jgi:hypothetical protein
MKNKVGSFTLMREMHRRVKWLPTIKVDTNSSPLVPPSDLAGGGERRPHDMLNLG